VSPPGLPPPPPAVQQQQQRLKAAVAEVCGLLLCQMHDRNCLRQFCPPAAFLCELATAAPARLQAEVAAAAARMGTQGDGSDEDGDGTDDSAWQQQQQWQQQRQQGLGPLAAAAAGTGAESALGSRDSSSNGATAAAHEDGADGAAAGAVAAAGGGRSPGSRVWVVLEHAPCLVPFELRVQLLQHVLELEKAAAVESGEMMHMWDDPMEAFQNRFVTIRWVAGRSWCSRHSVITRPQGTLSSHAQRLWDAVLHPCYCLLCLLTGALRTCPRLPT
jgi:hypothetical protein